MPIETGKAPDGTDGLAVGPATKAGVDRLVFRPARREELLVGTRGGVDNDGLVLPPDVGVGLSVEVAAEELRIGTEGFALLIVRCFLAPELPVVVTSLRLPLSRDWAVASRSPVLREG